MLTLEYELARGLREPGGNRDGSFEVGVSKTVLVPVTRLFDAFLKPRIRHRWLSGATLRLRTSLPHRSARFDWEDGTTRLVVGFAAKGNAKSVVTVVHERLPSAAVAAEARAAWRQRLAALVTWIER